MHAVVDVTVLCPADHALIQAALHLFGGAVVAITPPPADQDVLPLADSASPPKTQPRRRKAHR
jgi:hypothetical protein